MFSSYAALSVRRVAVVGIRSNVSLPDGSYALRMLSTTIGGENAAAHRPLVIIHGLQARYANATYIAASKAGFLDKVEAELTALHNTAEKSASFMGFLKDPMISRDAKTKFVSSLENLSPITRNLLSTLAGNARLSELPKVAATFQQLMKAKRGEIDAKIISAEKLTAAQLKDIETAMLSQVAKGKAVALTTEVDPSIVGGLQVQIGDQFLDLSVRSRIEEISRTPV